MVGSVDAVPVEILSQVFEVACDSPRPPRSPRCSPADRANLRNFSLVHSHWRRPAQELLLAHATVKVTAMHNDAAALARLCQRNSNFADCIRALRVHQFSTTAISADGETFVACETIITRCSKLRHLKLKLLTTSFEDLLLFPSSEIVSLDIEASKSRYRPALRSRSEPPHLLSNCRHLTVDTNTLQYLLSETRRYSLLQRHPVVPNWPALTSLSLTCAPSSRRSHAPDETARHDRVLLDHMPKIRALLSSIDNKRDVEVFAWPIAVRNRLLWTVSWQNFVDYMPPWRAFGEEIDALAETQALQLRHLYILPLPFDPIPPHFLDELTRRVAHDPSLRNLEGLWLPTRGWYRLVDGAIGERAQEGAHRFLRGCALSGVAVEWVDDYDMEGKEMPERYRRWAVAVAEEARDS